MERLIAYTNQACGYGGCGNVEAERSFVAAMIATMGAFFFIILAMAAAVFIFWIWMLVDAVRREEEDYKKIGRGDKTLWVVLLIASIFFQMILVSALVYFFLVYQKGKESANPVKK